MKKLGLAFVFVAIGCGGGDDGPATMTNTAAATASVDQAVNISDSIGTSDGLGAATAVQSLGASAQGIVVLAPAAREVPDELRLVDLINDLRADPAVARAGTCTCDATGCTFTACGDDAGTWTIDGTVSINGDTYTFDLTMDFNSQGYQWTWSYSGSITVTPTLLTGNLDGSGSGSFDDGMGGTITIDWSWSVDYNDIVLDGAGCATGGSLSAHVSYEAGTAQGGASFSGDGTVTFGPACGQATAS